MLQRISFTCLLFFAFGKAEAQWSLMDPVFGTGGVMSLSIGSEGIDVANDVLLQPDGRILIAGTRGDPDFPQMVAVRMTVNGTLDESFSNNGIAGAVIGDYGAAKALALQDDGRVLIGGTTRNEATFDDAALARFDANGLLDPAFTDDGVSSYPRSTSQDIVRALAIRTDGDIIAAGTLGGSVTDMMVMRLTPQGQLVGSFGQQGFAITSLHSGEVCNDMVLRPDGRIVLLGAMRLTLPDGDLNIRQLRADGTPDTAFADSGSFRPVEPGSISVAESGHLFDDGRLLFGGKRYVQGQVGADLFLGRILEDGEWDPGYGTGGRLALPISAPFVGDLKDIAVAPDGKTWVACEFTDTSTGTRSLAVLRAMPDGTLDAGFGSGGTVHMPCPFGGDCRIEAIYPQPDGRILAVGSTPVDTVTSDMLIMRWLPELSPVGIVDRNLPSFSVYPNPASDQVLINSPLRDAGSASFQLLDMLGRPVAQLAPSGRSPMRLHLPSGISDGAYALNMTTTQGTITRMLVVRR